MKLLTQALRQLSPSAGPETTCLPEHRPRLWVQEKREERSSSCLTHSLCSVKAHPPNDKMSSLQLRASKPTAADARQRLHQKEGREAGFKSVEARLPLGGLERKCFLQGSYIDKASSHSKSTFQHHPGGSPESETLPHHQSQVAPRSQATQPEDGEVKVWNMLKGRVWKLWVLLLAPGGFQTPDGLLNT